MDEMGVQKAHLVGHSIAWCGGRLVRARTPREGRVARPHRERRARGGDQRRLHRGLYRREPAQGDEERSGAPVREPRPRHTPARQRRTALQAHGRGGRSPARGGRQDVPGRQPGRRARSLRPRRAHTRDLGPGRSDHPGLTPRTYPTVPGSRSWKTRATCRRWSQQAGRTVSSKTFWTTLGRDQEPGGRSPRSRFDLTPTP